MIGGVSPYDDDVDYGTLMIRVCAFRLFSKLYWWRLWCFGYIYALRWLFQYFDSNWWKCYDDSIMRLVMTKYVYINEKGYLNESFNILIKVIMKNWFKYMNVMLSNYWYSNWVSRIINHGTN